MVPVLGILFPPPHPEVIITLTFMAIISLIFLVVLLSSCNLPSKVVVPVFELYVHEPMLYILLFKVIWLLCGLCVYISFIFIAVWFSTEMLFGIASCSLPFPNQTDLLPPCPGMAIEPRKIKLKLFITIISKAHILKDLNRRFITGFLHLPPTDMLDLMIHCSGDVLLSVGCSLGSTTRCQQHPQPSSCAKQNVSRHCQTSPARPSHPR